jgi:hypothetical protein
MTDTQTRPPTLTGVKELLEGPSGTGKTFAIGTAVDWCDRNGIESFVLFTEQGLETLLGYWTDRGKPIPASLHWHVPSFKTLSLDQLKAAANQIGMLTFQSLTTLNDASRAQNNTLERLLGVMVNFPDDRTGKTFGAVDHWGPDRFFWLDSLSELAAIINKSVIGSKPVMNQGEYGLAQNQLMNFLRLLTQGARCHFGMTAHVSREKDEVSGGVKLMTRAIGSAISGDIPPLFSDVIYSYREGDKFYWDTANSLVDVKTRYLPIASKLAPDFSVVLEKWKARNAAIAAPVASNPPA